MFVKLLGRSRPKKTNYWVVRLAAVRILVITVANDKNEIFMLAGEKVEIVVALFSSSPSKIIINI